MPAPATIDELLDMARKSGVVEEKRLSAYLETLLRASTVPETPRALAAALVRDGVLTNFQAQQLLQGRTRRFILASKYRLLESLGRGGMGCVYLCEHLFLRRLVAIKVLPPAAADDGSTLERFYREGRAVAVLNHPNIVRVYDMDRDAELHLLVMEYVDGSSLQELVRKNGPMDVLRACHYVCQAAIGLQHIHEAGLVHRDIKPGNLLLDRCGTIKILDMGLARFFNDENDDITRKHDETVLGTTDYLAPEQALDSNVDIRADIYSLGATFYYLIAGRTPFAEGTIAQKLIWHQTRQPKPIRSLRPELPEEVAAIIERMMVKDPATRYQTPAEIVAALEPWTAQPIEPPPDAEMPQLCPAVRCCPAKNDISSPRSTIRPSATLARPASPRPTAATASPQPAPPPPAPATPSAVQRPPAATPKPKSAQPRPAQPRSTAPTRRTIAPVRARTVTALSPEPQKSTKETALDQAALDTEAPMARADTEPTHARKKASAVVPRPEVSKESQTPEVPAKTARRRRLRLPQLSEQLVGMVFMAAIVLCALLIWVLLALLH